MATASEPGPDGGDPPPATPGFVEGDHVPPLRRRRSALRFLATVLLSVIVSAVLVRVAVEVVRWAAAP